MQDVQVVEQKRSEVWDLGVVASHMRIWGTFDPNIIWGHLVHSQLTTVVHTVE